MASKGQAQRGHSSGSRLAAWLAHHADSLRDAAGRLLQRPFGSLLSMLVIAVSLTIPLTVLATLHTARIGLGTWSQEAALIQLYLAEETDRQMQGQLLDSVQKDPEVASASLISPEQGLELMRRTHQLDGLLDQLKHNPLPAVIEVHPRDTSKLDGLRHRLAAMPGVSSARMDPETIARLRGLMSAGETLMMVFILLLTPALAITIGNTIRLELERRSHEVRLLQLIGATPAFIRRPLLYSGGMLGLGGTLLSFMLTWQAFDMLRQTALKLGWAIPATETPALFLLAATAIGFLLGVFAAWFATASHLRRIKPY